MAVLTAIYGEQPWIDQVAEIVRGGVDRGVRSLSQGGVERNARPLGKGGQYSFPPRTREELIATQNEVPALQGRSVVMEEQVDEGPEQRPSDGPMQWLL